MRKLLLCAALGFAVTTIGCGPEKCHGAGCTPDGEAGSGGGEAGSAGEAGAGGGGSGGAPGHGGSGGSGGTEAPDTSWAQGPAASCESDAVRDALTLEPFTNGATVGMFPWMEPGESQGATVRSYQNNMTAIELTTDDGIGRTIFWPGVISGFDPGEKVTVEQTAEWTVIRKKNNSFAAAMHKRIGQTPGAVLEPFSGGPELRYELQCNLQDEARCHSDVVALRSGSTTIASGGATGFVGPWAIRQRTLTRTPNCAQGWPDTFASLITVEGRP